MNHPMAGATPAGRRSRTFKAGLSLLILFTLILGTSVQAFAQGDARLLVSGLKINQYPQIQFNLELFDSQGNFVEDLKPGEISLTEDGRQVSSPALTLDEPGLEFIATFNTGPAFAGQGGASSTLESIRQQLLEWSANRAAGARDDYSLSTNTGLQVIRANDIQQWEKGLAEYQPDLAKSEPGLFSLTTAMDLATDTGTGSVSKRAVLYITQIMPQKSLAGLPDLTRRAAQAGVRIFVWVVTPSGTLNPTESADLQALADQTGGKLTLVNGRDPIPDLESWLKPLRKIYQVSYQSAVQKSGSHHLSVAVNHGEIKASISEDMVFSLTVLPPNPIFLSPPGQVQRQWTEATSNQPVALVPAALPMRIVIEFPDGYTRPLKATRLFVNGQLAAQNTAPPFDEFTWDLSQISESGTASLRVEAEDILGMVGSSITTPVEVVVQPQPGGLLLDHISRQGLVAVGAVAIAGVVLGLILAREGRLRGRKKRPGRRRMEDPVTQPVLIQQDLPHTRTVAPEPSTWPRAAAEPMLPARLMRLTEDEQPVPGSLVAVNRPEITFGGDPKLAVVSMDDPSVNALHARLVQDPDGNFLLLDEGSVAGTWVNYIPVPPQGVLLCHDDLIHFGRVKYRFELTNPPPVRPPVVTSLAGRP